MREQEKICVQKSIDAILLIILFSFSSLLKIMPFSKKRKEREGYRGSISVHERPT
jgi:hypothetical protein